jgi:DNA-binding PucR family transcriptional regulator
MPLQLSVCAPGLYRQMVAEAHAGSGVDVDGSVAAIATGLIEQVTEIATDLCTTLLDNVAEFPRDDPTVELMHRAIRDHLHAILRAVLDDIDVQNMTTPTTPIEYVRGLAQHDVPANAMMRAHRLGQRRVTELMLAELQAHGMDQTTRVAVIETITKTLLKYVDVASQQALAAFQDERKLVLESQESARDAMVLEVLGGDTAMDVDAVSTAIDYPLRWQHLALIVWHPAAQTTHDESTLQDFVRGMATAVDASASPLSVAVDATTAWAWLPYRSVPGDIVMKIREFVRLRPQAPHIAIGAMGSGVEGFRRSHRQARRAREATHARADRQDVVVAATDAGILASALLDAHVDEVRAWVADILGPLASDTADDARLRETLRVFLQLGSGYNAAAKELDMPLHAVKYSVEQAVARRGRPIDNQPDVALALLVCQWYGTAVLQPT